MTTHGSATVREETSHASDTTQNTISDALRRRAQLVINDRLIDPEWRSIISYALETNDPWLADLINRADAGETIIDALDFSQTPDADESDSEQSKIETLTEMICQTGDESAAALLVLMGMLETATQPEVLVNTAKHYAFTRCGELNLFGMVDAQIAVFKSELFASS